KGVLHIFRAKLLLDNICYEHIRVINFGMERVRARLSLLFGADFKDIFEVRGFQRRRRGTDLEPEIGERQVGLGYRGLDGTVRRTWLRFDPAPAEIAADAAHFDIDLAPEGEAHHYLTICCERNSECSTPLD